MKPSYFVLALSLCLVSCGPNQPSGGKFLKPIIGSGVTTLDYDAIAAALDPLIGECSQDSDCQMGEIPSYDSCSLSSDSVETGAYLVAQDAEFQVFKAELKAAIEYLISRRNPLISCSTPDPVAPKFYSDAAPVVKCENRFCKKSTKHTADFETAVNLSVRRDNIQSYASMAIMSGQFIRLGSSPLYEFQFDSQQPQNIHYGFSYSTTTGVPLPILKGTLTNDELQPLLTSALQAHFCSTRPFSWASAANIATPSIYCGSDAFGVNDLYNDHKNYSSNFCDPASAMAAQASVQIFKNLIASKLGALPTAGMDALNNLGAWVPRASDTQGGCF